MVIQHAFHQNLPPYCIDPTDGKSYLSKRIENKAQELLSLVESLDLRSIDFNGWKNETGVIHTHPSAVGAGLDAAEVKELGEETKVQDLDDSDMEYDYEEDEGEEEVPHTSMVRI